MAKMVSSEATNPPMLTMPVAVPSRAGGLKRAGEVEADHRARAADAPAPAPAAPAATAAPGRARPAPPSRWSRSRRRSPAPARTGAAGAAPRTGRTPARSHARRGRTGSSARRPRCGLQALARTPGTGSPTAARTPCRRTGSEVRPQPEPGARVRQRRAQLPTDVPDRRRTSAVLQSRWRVAQDERAPGAGQHAERRPRAGRPASSPVPCSRAHQRDGAERAGPAGRPGRSAGPSRDCAGPGTRW